MGLSLKMQSSAVPTSSAHPPVHQPLSAEQPHHCRWTPHYTRCSPSAVLGC